MPRILLVEDDQTIRNMYAFTLGREGFEVTLGTSGAEALEKAREIEAPFDIMVLDMMMMGGSGLDFLRSYDVRKKSPQTIVVGLSNLDTPEVVERAKKLGVQHYLVKANYDPLELAQWLKQLLRDRDPNKV